MDESGMSWRIWMASAAGLPRPVIHVSTPSTHALRTSRVCRRKFEAVTYFMSSHPVPSRPAAGPSHSAKAVDWVHRRPLHGLVCAHHRELSYLHAHCASPSTSNRSRESLVSGIQGGKLDPTTSLSPRRIWLSTFSLCLQTVYDHLAVYGSIILP